MPYPDLSITLVKSVKSLRCTWVVAATLIALPEYYQNRFRLSWLNITQKGILKKGRFPESLFLSLPPRRSPESRRKVNGSCGVGLVSLAAVFLMSHNTAPPPPPQKKKNLGSVAWHPKNGCEGDKGRVGAQRNSVRELPAKNLRLSFSLFKVWYSTNLLSSCYIFWNFTEKVHLNIGPGNLCAPFVNRSLVGGR